MDKTLYQIQSLIINKEREEYIMFVVTCLDNGKQYYFDAKTPYEALDKAKYYLNLKHKDEDVTINKTESGKHLYFEHYGMTYVVANN